VQWSIQIKKSQKAEEMKTKNNAECLNIMWGQIREKKLQTNQA